MTKIPKKEVISGKNPKLFFDGKQLEPEKLLKDYNIENDSILHLDFFEDFLINVKMLSGKVLKLRFSIYNIVADIKKKIKEYEQIEIDNQILLFNQIPLEDSYFLTFYKNIDKGIVELVFVNIQKNIIIPNTLSENSLILKVIFKDNSFIII